VLPDCSTLELRVAGPVLHLTFYRPAVRNALSTVMWQEISAVFSAICDDRSLRAVVLRGAGGYFCAGADLTERAAIATPATGDEDPMRERNRMGGRILTQIESAPQVVICVVEGAAIGGGLGFVCACDIALTLGSAHFSIPEVSLGIPPAQIAPFLTRRIGQSQARRLALTAASIDGRSAAAVGLVHEAFGDSASLEAALAATLQQIARCAPGALAHAKQLIALTQTTGREEYLDRASGVFLAAARGPEGVEGAAAFREKRAPSWNKTP
jgi:isohexenylglutaconyl-CoA hydratase